MLSYRKRSGQPLLVSLSVFSTSIVSLALSTGTLERKGSGSGQHQEALHGPWGVWTLLLWLCYEKGSQCAAQTCCVYRLPSEFTRSILSSVVRKPRACQSDSNRRSSRGSGSKGSNSSSVGLMAATKSAGQRQSNIAMSGAASKSPRGRGGSMNTAEPPPCPQWMLKCLWRVLSVPFGVLLDVMGRYTQRITTVRGIVLYVSRVVGKWVLTVVIFLILSSLSWGYFTIAVSQVAVMMKVYCLRKP